MKKNIGKIDKTIRLIIALVIIILISTCVITGTFSIIAGIIALALIFSSLTGYCGLYSVLGIKTCQVDKNN